MGKREVLPWRRPSESFDLNHDGLHFAVQVGYYDDGRPGEIFISSPKTGSMAEINARDAAVLASIALQRGADPEKTLLAMTHDSDGKPEGVVGRVLEQLVADAPTVSQPKPTDAPFKAQSEPAIDRSNAKLFGYTGDQCSNCNSMRMTRNGSCLKCEDCATTTGCS